MKNIYATIEGFQRQKAGSKLRLLVTTKYTPRPRDRCLPLHESSLFIANKYRLLLPLLSPQIIKGGCYKISLINVETQLQLQLHLRWHFMSACTAVFIRSPFALPVHCMSSGGVFSLLLCNLWFSAFVKIQKLLHAQAIRPYLGVLERKMCLLN